MSGQPHATPTEFDSVQTDERRQWARFISTVGEVSLQPPGGAWQTATVVDESFGGIGLIARDATGLGENALVDVIYDGAEMQAIVRYICPTDDGRYRVGMQWHTRLNQEGSDRDKLVQFESRLFSLFRLLEISDWEALQNAAAQLEEDAGALALDVMRRAAAQLRKSLEHGESSHTISTALERLVDVCTEHEG